MIKYEVCQYLHMTTDGLIMKSIVDQAEYVCDEIIEGNIGLLQCDTDTHKCRLVELPALVVCTHFDPEIPKLVKDIIMHIVSDFESLNDSNDLSIDLYQRITPERIQQIKNSFKVREFNNLLELQMWADGVTDTWPHENYFFFTEVLQFVGFNFYLYIKYNDDNRLAR